MQDRTGNVKQRKEERFLHLKHSGNVQIANANSELMKLYKDKNYTKVCPLIGVCICSPHLYQLISCR